MTPRSHFSRSNMVDQPSALAVCCMWENLQRTLGTRPGVQSKQKIMGRLKSYTLSVTEGWCCNTLSRVVVKLAETQNMVDELGLIVRHLTLRMTYQIIMDMNTSQLTDSILALEELSCHPESPVLQSLYLRLQHGDVFPVLDADAIARVIRSLSLSTLKFPGLLQALCVRLLEPLLWCSLTCRNISDIANGLHKLQFKNPFFLFRLLYRLNWNHEYLNMNAHDACQFIGAYARLPFGSPWFTPTLLEQVKKNVKQFTIPQGCDVLESLQLLDGGQSSVMEEVLLSILKLPNHNPECMLRILVVLHQMQYRDPTTHAMIQDRVLQKEFLDQISECDCASLATHLMELGAGTTRGVQALITRCSSFVW